MKFLGVLLIIVGVVALFGSPVVGLIIIAIGAILCAASTKSKEKEKEEKTAKVETANKDSWIAKRVEVLMREEGMLPSDAKVKAETEYVLAKEKEKIARANPKSSINAYEAAIAYIKKKDLESDKFIFSPWSEKCAESEGNDKFKVYVEYYNARGVKTADILHATYKGSGYGWKVSY